ncbi:MAG TPA: adenylosuccinate lyase [Rhabdochlamydiaceae bacterium]|nr:adenylosuccinate lyase [Rhabdochlamydiaceae bacterium]
MNCKEDHYESPFSRRYGSCEMRTLFSAQKKFSTWRKIWVALAEAEMLLGLSITQKQIDLLKEKIDSIDLVKAENYEKELRHDVMAHIRAYGDECPEAAGIIHLGATSCLVTDNAEMILIHEALELIETKLKRLMKALLEKADFYRNLACLSYTHFQPAQPTTVGKRFCLWLQDFWLDWKDLNYRKDNFCFLGVKGATGTQASFLELFNGDHEKVKELDQLLAERLGFNRVFSISGQTYTRKQDSQLLDLLSGIGVSAHKMATDIRLLVHLKEVAEPFKKNQVGSTAMPYKRNPIESEKVCSLARYLIALSENPKYTASLQWLERSLDDSANRRFCIPEAFLCVDAILDSLLFITENLQVNQEVINKHLEEEMPSMSLEPVLMALSKKGASRQEVHETLRTLSQQDREKGNRDEKSDLLSRIAENSSLPLTLEEIQMLSSKERLVGRAPQQVSEFLEEIKNSVIFE